MNVTKTCSLSLLLLATPVALGARAWVDPVLLEQVQRATPEEDLSAYVVLREQADLTQAVEDARRQGGGLAERHFEVITRAQEVARRSQIPLLAHLDEGARRGEVVRYRAFWVSNAVAVKARPEFITALAERPEIKAIFTDYPIELIAPVGAMRAAPDATDSVENGILVTGATDLWAIGIDGTGTLACDQDTGADGTHPALADRWRGLDPGVDPAHAWFDPIYNETFPTDSGSHGSHTLGTMIGDDGGDNQIGMAPGAKWIGAKTVDVPNGNLYSDAVAGFEWAADPDGDPTTMDDVPDVVNNSWGLAASYYGACLDDFNGAIDTTEAAGVVVIFAAGNEGTGGLRSPGSRIATEWNTFAVGALNQDNTSIASFSSRGPSQCDGVTIKPEISAVGVGVRSSVPGGGYATYDGTSMSSPTVSGAVLLLRQAFPEATPEEIKMGLYYSATDLGNQGDDNAYGMGAMNVYEAYLWLEKALVNSEGKVQLGEVYSCADTITITVSDIDLQGAFVAVEITSSTELAGETVLLEPTSTSGVYRGTIPTSSADAEQNDGVLSVADVDVIEVAYLDEDDGEGNVNVLRTDQAVTDCVAPEFAGLATADAGDFMVTLGWAPASDASAVSYNVYRASSAGGQDLGAPLGTTAEVVFYDNDVLNGQTYFYVVQAVDVLGNESGNLEELSVTPQGPDRLFSDDFEGEDALGRWQITNGGKCSQTWTEVSCASGATWCDGMAAFVDRTDCRPRLNMDEALTSPAIDCSRHTGLELWFGHYFDQGSKEFGDIDYSFDGVQWTNLIRYSRDNFQGSEVLDFSVADGKPVVFVRIRYHNTGVMSQDWAIDNLAVVGWPID